MANKSGFGMWENVNPYSEKMGEIVVSETRPEDGYVPLYNPRRVRGHVYTPYAERTDWHKAANRAMADQAQKNFQHGRR